MSDMTTHQNSSKVLLLTDDHAVSTSAQKMPIKRFKIARIRPENRPAHELERPGRDDS
jgi:hypothetical protein